MFIKGKAQILGIMLIVVIAALALSAFTVAAQGGTWGGGGMIVTRFGDLFVSVLRFLALIFGF